LFVVLITSHIFSLWCTELFCLSQYTIFLFCVFYISTSHAVSFERITKHNNLDVLELSLPDRQCWVSWQRPSSFYFIKRTKTAARTLRAIYTAYRRVCLRAKSCSGQEMRRAMLFPVSILYTQISTFSPLSPMSRPVRHLRKLSSVIRNFPFVSEKKIAGRILCDE